MITLGKIGSGWRRREKGLGTFGQEALQGRNSPGWDEQAAEVLEVKMASGREDAGTGTTENLSKRRRISRSCTFELTVRRDRGGLPVLVVVSGLMGGKCTNACEHGFNFQRHLEARWKRAFHWSVVIDPSASKTLLEWMCNISDFQY
jgi:hypothetical protein